MPQNVGLDLFDGINNTVLSAFGEDFTWIRSTGDIVSGLSGVFEARHYEAEVNGEIGVSDYQASLSCRRDAVPEVARGQQVTVRGATWDINDIRPDSEGWVVLVLGRVD